MNVHKNRGLVTKKTLLKILPENTQKRQQIKGIGVAK
jgi:hypothetical protein